MITPQLEEALKGREVLRLQESGVEVRLYDTDQILVLAKQRLESETRREENRRVTEELELPVTISYDLRTEKGYTNVGGRSFISYAHYNNLECFNVGVKLLEANGVDLNKWKVAGDTCHISPQRYPELSKLVSDLQESIVHRKWGGGGVGIIGYISYLGLSLVEEVASKGFINTSKSFINALSSKEFVNNLLEYGLNLLGYGVICLLHPIDTVVEMVFPKYVLDFKKGRESLEGRTEYMNSKEGASYDGNVILIRPRIKDPRVIEAHFFNPANYKKFLEGKLTVENHLPSARDWKFEVTYGIEPVGSPWLYFSANRFDYEGVEIEDYLPKDLFEGVDGEIFEREDRQKRERFLYKREHFLDQREDDIYLKADDGLVGTLEKIAPLPI